MPVQTRQTTRAQIAAETARDIAHAHSLNVAPGSLVDFISHNRATVRHELNAAGQPVSRDILRDTLMRQYITSQPDWPEPESIDDELTTFAVGDTVKITRGIHSIGVFAPDHIVGYILAIDAETDLADILISHPDVDDTLAHPIPLAWLEHRPEHRWTLADTIQSLIDRITAADPPAPAASAPPGLVDYSDTDEHDDDESDHEPTPE